MQYNDNAQLDTSAVEDARTGGGLGGGLGGVLASRGGLAGGGLGILGLTIYLLVNLLGGSGGGTAGALGSVLTQLNQQGGTVVADNTAVSRSCRTGADANAKLECAVIADIDSIQEYWSSELPALGRPYQPVPTVWFSGQVSTGCGVAASGAGPFYCPADQNVYIDLSFYKQIQTQFKAADTPFVNAYVLAHEYGHHVQNLLGTEARVRSRQGAGSDAVRLELQADCYAGVWARHATEPSPNGTPPLITSITHDDLDSALVVASRIGDDWIQKNLGGGRIDQHSFTHGSSAQRQRWLTVGYQSGDPGRCDTFGAADLG